MANKGLTAITGVCLDFKVFFFGAVADQGLLLEMSTESIFGAHGVRDGECLPLPSIQVPKIKSFW